MTASRPARRAPTPRPLLAAALLAATGAVQAQAPAPAPAAAATSPGVTMYGLIDIAARRATNANAARDTLRSLEDGIFTGSRLGWRLREDLGGGLSAVGVIEHGFDPSTGASGQGTATADFGQTAGARVWGRDLFLGLRTDTWTLTAGHQYTLAHSLAGRFQAQGNPNSTALSLFSSHHVARQDNVLRGELRAAGLEFSAMRTLGEVAGNGGANGAWALGVSWQGKDGGAAAYVQELDNLAGTETRRVIGLGGQWRVSPAVQVFGGLMRRSSAVSVQTNTAWTASANLELSPSVTLSLSHMADDQGGSAALEGSRSVSFVQAAYRFSRRTDVYALLDHNVVSGGYAKPAFMGVKGTQNGLTVGLRHRF
jgi:predicted porin